MTTWVYFNAYRRISHVSWGGAAIVFEQSTETLAALGLTGAFAGRFIGFDQSITNTLVVPLTVIVFEERSNNSAHGGFTEQDHPVKAFAFQGAEESFQRCVEVGTSRWQDEGQVTKLIAVPSSSRDRLAASLLRRHSHCLHEQRFTTSSRHCHLYASLLL